MKAARLLAVTAVGFGLVPIGGAADWPQWLGPERDAVWREDGVRRDLPSDGAKVVWRVPAALGYAGPAVADGRVYLPEFEVTDGEFDPSSQRAAPLIGKERIRCLDAASGDELWRHEYLVTYTISYPGGPRVTPSVVDGRLYFQGTMGDFLCLDAASGALLWRHDLGEKYDTEPPRWGFSSHPLVHDGLVFTLAGGKGSTLVAFDAETGEERWRALDADEAGYCPPSVIEHAGVEQLLVWYPKGVVGLNPADGEVHWTVDLLPRFAISWMAPVKHEDKLFLSGPGPVGALLELDDDRPDASVVWRGTPRNAVYCLNSIPQMRDGMIYGVDSETSLLMGVSMEDGERVWTTREPTLAPEAPDDSRHGTAFLVYHEPNGQYWLFSETGDLILAELSPDEGYRELGRQHLLDPTNEAWGRPVVWSHPAFAMRSVFARNDKELVRVDLSDAEAGEDGTR